MIITNSRHVLVGYFITSYPTRAHGIIVKYSPILKIARLAKKIRRIIKTIVAIWGENMLGCLSLDIICSSKLTVFLELLACEQAQLFGYSLVWVPRTGEARKSASFSLGNCSLLRTDRVLTIWRENPEISI